MRAFLLNGVCLNGMVRESVWKQIHLGAKLPGNLRLSDRTYELDTQATVSAVRDLARQLYSRETIRKKAIEIQRASETDVDFTTELQRLVKNNRLLKNESEQVEQLLMQNRPEDGRRAGNRFGSVGRMTARTERNGRRGPSSAGFAFGKGRIGRTLFESDLPQPFVPA